MTPEEIRSKLFYFSDAAHVFHHDTRSFAEHGALGKLYEGLLEFRDDIPELLMGYMNGKRLGKVKVGDIPAYSQDALTDMVKEGLKFAYELEKFAEDKNYCDIANTAQALSGLFAKTQYLLTLS